MTFQALGVLRALPALRWAVGTLLFAGVLAASWRALYYTPPTFEIRLSGSAAPLITTRSLAEAEAALNAWAYAELTQPIELYYRDLNWPYLRSELGLMIDLDAIRSQLRSQWEQIPLWDRVSWRRFSFEVEPVRRWDLARLQLALEPVSSALSSPPVNAQLQVVDRRPMTLPEVEGRTVHVQTVRSALERLGSNQRLEVPVTAVLPDVTADAIASWRIKGVIAEWTTNYDPTIPRAENVERAAAAFHGKLLKPGEILSYNATVGPISTDSGWKEAYVIVEGQLVPGVGGGVCQVATTFYGAALRANLEILERHSHQLVVPYVSSSQDAAIAQGWEDLKLRNTALGHLYIETEARKGSVTFRLYGEVPEGQEVQIQSKVIESRPFPSKEIVDTKLGRGQRVVKLAGSNGLSSEAYRLVYRKGKLVKKELLSRDHYLPATEVVLVGG